MIRLAKLSFAFLLAGFGLIAGLGGMNLYTYHRFAGEAAVATLAFQRMDGEVYRVSLKPASGAEQQFELRGDEWQLDARMIKWTDWLTFLGETPLYRLDRISGRYISVVDAMSNRPLIHDLSDSSGIDVWSFAREAGDWLPGVDAVYGSSVYLPMGDGLRYEVSISRTGLVARQLPAVGQQ